MLKTKTLNPKLHKPQALNSIQLRYAGRYETNDSPLAAAIFKAAR